MQKHFRYWRTIYYGYVVAVATAIMFSICVPGSVNPILFFVSSVGLLGAAWTLIAYPVANRILFTDGELDATETDNGDNARETA